MTSRLPEERFFISARRVTFTEGNKIRDERHKDLIDVKDALREYNRIADAILTYLSLIK